MTPSSHLSCDACRAPLALGQRYCLHCGTRRGAPRVTPELAWDPAADVVGAAPAGKAGTVALAPAAATTTRRRKPSRSLSTVLGATALLTGGLLGVLLGAPADPSLASSRRPVVVVAVPTATSPAPAPVAAPVADDTAAAAADVPPETVTITAAAETPAAMPAPADTPTTPTTTSTTPTTTTPAATTPHVWVVSLSHVDGADLTGASAPPFFGELAKQGLTLSGYAPLPGGSVPNGVALLSGQAPNPATLDDCPVSSDVPEDSYDAATGLAAGPGCVYPKSVLTLPDQLTATSQTWRAYVQGTGDPCRPAPRNPFLSFRALLDMCAKNVTGLDALAGDLAEATRTPAFSWIVPDAQHDGRASVSGDGTPTGPQDAAAFLADLVPTITATQAYTDGGLIAIVPDTPATAPGDDPAAAPVPTGAILLSPKLRAGKAITTATGPYHLLRYLEDFLGLGPLGHAGDTTVVPLDTTVLKTDPGAASRRRATQPRIRPGGHVAAHPSAR